jgi:hypothetical protein
MDNVEFEIFDFIVDEPDKLYNQKFELSKNVISIEGIVITSNLDDLLYYRGRQRIEINGREYFPQKYESKLLMTSLNIPPNLKYYDMEGVKPGDGIIKFSFQDTEHPRTIFSPYSVHLYVKCQIDQ